MRVLQSNAGYLLGCFGCCRYSSTRSPSPRVRRPSQTPRPNSPIENQRCFILTLKLSDNIHQSMTRLRNKYFPPALNKLQAHVTLFHALPESHMQAMMRDIGALAQTTHCFSLSAEEAKLHGKTILVPVADGNSETCKLRMRMRNRWKDFLSDQDLRSSVLEPGKASKGWQPHWTIMNKEPDVEKAKAAFEEIQRSFTTVQGSADGLSLFEYLDDGRWKHEQDWQFQDGSPA